MESHRTVHGGEGDRGSDLPLSACFGSSSWFDYALWRARGPYIENPQEQVILMTMWFNMSYKGDGHVPRTKRLSSRSA